MKPVRREVNSHVREVGKSRPLVVTVEPDTGLIGIRAKGCRRTEWIPANTVWSFAVKLRVAQEKREKRKKK